MIKVEGLTKYYGARKAVDNIDFHAERGEIVGFLGPNGAGKTTTMRILSGYMPPTSGSASIAGFDVVEQSLEVRKRVGYLPETVPLYTDMSVFDYLKFMGDLRKLSDVEDRVDDVLEMVNLEDRAFSFIGGLSKGMRQRVGLAQALLHNPDVLILDEPTIGLDPAQIIEIRNLIRELGQEHTILLSTHILSEVQALCDRILVINQGRIVAKDTPENLARRLEGDQHIVIKVGGAAEGLLETLQAVSNVQRVDMLSENQYEVTTGGGGDSRPALAKAVVKGGYDLLELREEAMSLEEIFLELTASPEDIVNMASDEDDEE